MIRIFASISLAFLMALYFGASDLKYETQEAKKELRDVERQIGEEKEAISVLSAEWSHLTRPENLRQLAQSHLGLDRVRVEQIAAIEDVPYLGMDIFEQPLDAVPVDYLPRKKPQGSRLKSSPPTYPGMVPFQVAQVEFVQIEGRDH
jgi:cell division protein FtsL